MITVQSAIEFLVTNGYIVRSKNKFLVMQQKLEKALRDTPAKATTTAVVKLSAQDWVDRYQQFISDAKIPRRCEDNSGGWYNTNQYSIDGMKAFRKAIEGGAIYETLVASTALYYKSGVRLKQSIGRYMQDGTWKTDYDELMRNASEGTVAQHIKKEIDDGAKSFTRLG